MKSYSMGITKKEFVKELKRHQKLDAFISGTYGQGAGDEFQGCAVGCSLHSVSVLKGVKLSTKDHNLYEKHLGIPEWLARVEDTIFEGVSKKRQKTWPVEFGKAIPEGVDLDQAKAPFLIFILESTLDKFNHKKFPDVFTAVTTVINLHRSGETDLEKFRAAAEAAAKAAEAAAKAAEAAAKAAEAAAEAAWAAAWAAKAAEAAWAAAWAAKAAAEEYEKFADKLLELLRDAK